MILGALSMHIDCHVCNARYHMDPSLFKGAKGIRLRCRKCGNSLDVLNPAGIGSDGDVPNDTSFSRDPSGNSGVEPALPLTGQEQPPSPEMDFTLPVEEPACFPREDREGEEYGEENWRMTLSELAEGYVPSPKPPPKPRWSPLIVLFIFLLLFVGGSAYFIFTKVGKGVLSGIGQNLTDTVSFFRS